MPPCFVKKRNQQRRDEQMGNTFRFLLRQHIGVPCTPVVKEGDRVKRGMLIAKPLDNQLGANIHTSVSGTVTQVNEQAIEIAEEGIDYKTYEPLTGETVSELVKEAGIVGLGGAGFPTSVKLNTKLTKDGVVIINAAECEPILSHNMKRIQVSSEEIVRGLEYAMEALEVTRGMIAIKEKHKDEVAMLEKACKEKKIKIVLLEDLYPMGEERAIVREALHKLLPVTALPSEADAVVINVETAYRIKEAVEDKKPLIDKDLTVAGKLKGSKLIQTCLDVPIGTRVETIFEQAGGLREEYGELIMGGPFTGKRTSLNDYVVKTTGGLLATESFLHGPKKLGLLVCACGANKDRLTELAESMGSEVVNIQYCKQAHEVKGTFKCENPGRCPGQVAKVMALKKAGAEAVLISNCTDCSNTVMSCAPALNLPVYHCTDGALRAVNMRLIRKHVI